MKRKVINFLIASWHSSLSILESSCCNAAPVICPQDCWKSSCGLAFHRNRVQWYNYSRVHWITKSLAVLAVIITDRLSMLDGLHGQEQSERESIGLAWTLVVKDLEKNHASHQGGQKCCPLQSYGSHGHYWSERESIGLRLKEWGILILVLGVCDDETLVDSSGWHFRPSCVITEI